MSLQLLPLVLWESIQWGDPDAFTDWLLPHWLHHIEIAKVTGTPLIPLDNLRDDPGVHDQLHRQEAAKLGLPVTFDFSDYDLKNKDSFKDFMLAHATAHSQLAQAAGL